MVAYAIHRFHAEQGALVADDLDPAQIEGDVTPDRYRRVDVVDQVADHAVAGGIAPFWTTRITLA